VLQCPAIYAGGCYLRCCCYSCRCRYYCCCFRRNCAEPKKKDANSRRKTKDGTSRKDATAPQRVLKMDETMNAGAPKMFAAPRELLRKTDAFLSQRWDFDSKEPPGH
jgi:hypothetical protein